MGHEEANGYEVDVSDDDNSKPGASDNINVSDLMTSSPIMNKKKMLQHIKEINQTELE